jgi:hypothetical protein
LANIVFEMSVDEVSLISYEEHATVEFLGEASGLGIRVTNVLEFKSGMRNKTDQALKYINGLDQVQPVIVMILDAKTILEIAQAIETSNGLKNVPIWIMASVGLGQMQNIQAWKNTYHGGIVLEPYLPELDQFRQYFQNSLIVSLSFYL